ncbi:hypothetical protein [Nesterenkonia muleiensis]|uniref:hypothetical protein n=1 Tax=Nesterenkonia muleiensis TaxID=2282648 RepID=UPI001300B296|nr:hypothetical protein [Nesterenkonia muleiensis]
MTPQARPMAHRTEQKKNTAGMTLLRQLARREAEQAREEALLSALQKGLLLR